MTGSRSRNGSSADGEAPGAGTAGAAPASADAASASADPASSPDGGARSGRSSRTGRRGRRDWRGFTRDHRALAAAKFVAACAVAGLLVGLALLPIAGSAGWLSNRAMDTTNATMPGVMNGTMPEITTVTDDTGAPVAQLFDQDRTSVPSEQIAVTMKAAIVSVEDRRFFSEAGLDPQGVARAAMNNSSGGSTQGASTLTQQYVKNYDEQVAAKTPAEQLRAAAPTIGRKLREARVAVQLDQHVPKDEILTRYLNLVAFGNGLYGVGAAARTYFHTTPDRLTIPQAALLAGMVQSPTAFDPIKHPQAATDRRNLAIKLMAEQGAINPDQARDATASPLGADPALPQPTSGCVTAGDAGYFCTYLLDYLRKAGFTTDQLRTGGYTIRTTLNRDALTKAKAAVDRQAKSSPSSTIADVLALVAPGPTAHPVTALVANRPYGLNAANKETTYGLPSDPVNLGAGSVYKIFTSTKYLENGGHISDKIPVPQPRYSSPLTPGFTIPNFASNYPDPSTLQEALAQSPNTAFVKLLERTGIPPVVDTAVSMGLRSLADPQGKGKPSVADQVKAGNQASFTLGVAPTSPLELANVGATLGAHGTWCPPTPITSMTDHQGRPMNVRTEPCQQVVPPKVADEEMLGLSKDDTGQGTSTPAAEKIGWDRPIAAKTGTTSDTKSAFFFGAMPNLAGAAAVFDDSPRPRPICDDADSSPTSCSDGTLTGGGTPARTFYQAAKDILGTSPPVPLPPLPSR